MELIKSFLLVVVSVLLFVSLLASGIFLTLGLSLNYENVNSKITSLATNIINEQIGEVNVAKYLPLMKTYCEKNPNYVFNEQGYNFSLSCDEVPNSTEQFVNSTINSLVSDFYYKEYNCEFWSCLKQEKTPLFLVSEYAQNYWISKFYTTLIISLILFVLTILLASKKSNGLILSGSLIFVVSLIVSKLDPIGTKIVNALIKPVAGVLSGVDSKEMISKIVSVFFSESSRVFLWMFIIGLILIGIGILLKIFKIGFKISNLFEKGEKLFSKQETEKQEKEELQEKPKQEKNSKKEILKDNFKKIEKLVKENSQKK